MVQAHMFAFEIKLLMAKCIHCSRFHKLMMAGTIMFSKYRWLFFFARGTGLSLTFTAAVHDLHFEKEKGEGRGGKHLWLLCEQEWAQSLPLCLWNENDAWLISVHLTEVSWHPCRCRRAGLIKTKFLGLYTTERITYVLGRETKCFCSQWWEGSERSSPEALHLLLRDVPARVANVLTVGEGRLTAFLGLSLVLKSERFCWFGFKGCFITSALTIHSKYAYFLSDIDYIIRYAALTIQT